MACTFFCENFWLAIGAIGTIGGFLIAILTLRKNNQLKKIDNLLKLRDLFFIHEKELQLVNQISVNPMLVLSYLGLFEIIYDMYQNETIDIETIKNYYKYKIDYVFTNNNFSQIISANEGSWKKLIELKNLVQN